MRGKERLASEQGWHAEVHSAFAKEAAVAAGGLTLAPAWLSS